MTFLYEHGNKGRTAAESTASEDRDSEFKSWTANGVTLNSYPASSGLSSLVSETEVWS